MDGDCLLDKKLNANDLTLTDWADWLKENGQAVFRAKQIFTWIYEKRIASFEEMTNLSKELREMLSEHFVLEHLRILNKHLSEDGTVKFLFSLDDGHAIETVLMTHEYGISVCVTTQVGCKMGCSFCASTLGGLLRNLTAGEIVSQVLTVQKYLDNQDEQGRVSSIVVMGTGEPFDNFAPTLKFISIINDQLGLNIGSRHITISTSGVIPNIYHFADLHMQVGLAISLHAPTDDLRSSLMPINRKYPLAELIKACKYYISVTNRRITFEYALMGGINDQDQHAKQLAELLKGINCHVNLIPVNFVPEKNFVRTSKKQIHNFKRILEKYQVNVTIRREQGGDIEAACGQLRAKHIEKEFKL